MEKRSQAKNGGDNSFLSFFEVVQMCDYHEIMKILEEMENDIVELYREHDEGD